MVGPLLIFFISLVCNNLYNIPFSSCLPLCVQVPSGDSEEGDLPPPRLPASSTTQRGHAHEDYDDHSAAAEPEPESEPSPAGGDKWKKPGAKPEPRPRAGAAGHLSWSMSAVFLGLVLSLAAFL